MPKNKYRQFPTTGGMDPLKEGMKYSKKRQIKSVAEPIVGKPRYGKGTRGPVVDVSASGAKKTIKSRKANMKSIMEELDK